MKVFEWKHVKKSKIPFQVLQKNVLPIVIDFYSRLTLTNLLDLQIKTALILKEDKDLKMKKIIKPIENTKERQVEKYEKMMTRYASRHRGIDLNI